MKSLDCLKDRSDFLRVRNANQKWVSPTMIVQKAPSDKQDGMRYGITITKKIFKSAVKRNRVKRRLRAAAFEVFTSLEDHPPADFVLIGRAPALNCPYDKLKNDLTWCVKRLHKSQSTLKD